MPSTHTQSFEHSFEVASIHLETASCDEDDAHYDDDDDVNDVAGKGEPAGTERHWMRTCRHRHD